MTTILIVGALIGLAFLLSFAWRSFDNAREETVGEMVADMASLGDVAPPSLHPKFDLNRCIGSGACIRACPEHDVIALVGGQAKLINPLGCVGHGACLDACAFDAIKLVFGTETRGVELPKINQNFETNQPGIYIIGELGGMGLIRNAVMQGAQAIGYIAKGNRRGGGDVLDALVVGAGPAGIGATLGAMDAGLDVLMVEREDLGGTILHYPRAKVVMTGALEFPLYGTVKKRTMTKEKLVELWEDIREKTNLPVTTGELVEAIEANEDGTWTVRSSKSAWRAANVLLALGRRGSPRKLAVPGEDISKVAYRLLEPKEFDGKHVLVVGGGNSAVESVFALIDQAQCKSVSISYRKEDFARCRGDNKQRIADLLAAKQVNGFLPSTVKIIDEASVTLRAKDSPDQRIPNDAIIVQIGGTSPAKLLQSFGIKMVTKYGES